MELTDKNRLPLKALNYKYSGRRPQKKMGTLTGRVM